MKMLFSVIIISILAVNVCAFTTHLQKPNNIKMEVDEWQLCQTFSVQSVAVADQGT